MKIIILAAGIGKRFNQDKLFLNEMPKCLMKVEGNKTVLDINIENILSCSKLSEVLIITGFKSELIDSHIKTNYCENAKLKTNFNPRFKESVIFSVKQAFDMISNEEAVLLINGDTVFNKSIFEKAEKILIKNTDSITLFGYVGNKFYPDDIKVLVKNSKMKKVGKRISNVNAVSSGAILFCNDGLNKYHHTLNAESAKELKMHHDVLQRIKDSGYEIDFCDLGSREWHEIDTPTDLRRARNKYCQLY